MRSHEYFIRRLFFTWNRFLTNTTWDLTILKSKVSSQYGYISEIFIVPALDILHTFISTNNSTTCKWFKLKVFLFLKHNANWKGLNVIEETGVVGGENVKRKKSVMWYTKKWQVRYEEFWVMAFRQQNDKV